MKGTTVLVALLVVAGIVAVPAVGAAVQQDTDERNDGVQTGERIAGIAAVQEAEIEGELDRHAYENALDRADDDASTAAVIADRVNASEERLQEIEERKAELDQQREGGEISESEYRVEIARLSAEANATERTLDRSEEAASGLPEHVLVENGVNVTAIQELRQNAHNMNGEEVSRIARSITGDSPGAAPGDAPANDRADDRAGDRPDSGAGAGDENANKDGNAENHENANKDGNAENDENAESDDGQSGDAGNSTTD